MSLKSQIADDIKSALRAREQARLNALRLLLAAVKQREVDERIEIDDAAVLGIVEKLIKQRRDAATQYDAGGRPELAAAERFEIEVLRGYMPAQLSPAEIETILQQAIASSGATGMQDMGKAMSAAKPHLAGRADMAAVSARLKALLA